MKTKPPASTASVSLRILVTLVAAALVLATVAGYARARTVNSGTKPGQQALATLPNGNVTEAWVRRIDGPLHGDDHAHDVKIDSAGNVVVTGWIETLPGLPDCYTVKYSPDGDVLWENTYAGSPSGYDYGYALAVDQDGNAYVAGFGNGNNPTFDIFILKYDTNGNQVWTQRWSSPLQNYSAYAYSVAVDNQGNVYATGFESDGLTNGHFVTLKYDSLGNLQWSAIYEGPGPNSIDYSNCIVVDNDGNSYITGWSGDANNLYDYATIKYSPTGDQLWVKRYGGSANDNDFAYRLALDASGNIYVTGQTVNTGSDNDITTIKYSPNGDVLWAQSYNGPGNGYDAGQAIAVDADGNAYVTGNHTTATGLECVTLKYSAAGNLLWTASYNGPDASGGVFISIALDSAANAYVSGFVFSGGATDFATVKYDTNGNQQWAQLYNGPGNSYDGTYAIAVDDNRNVVVAGYSTGDGTGYDYTTIKYSQSGAPTPTPSATPTPTATPLPRVTPSPRPRPTPRPRP
jgi:uncharacterized delta-60 repeat protein